MEKANRIYLDYAATTPVDKRVVSAMEPFFHKRYGNPASLHTFGQEAKKALRASREKIARFLGARPKEIIFTSSATESNNLALKGAFLARGKGGHVIVSPVEHDCVLGATEWLEGLGFKDLEVTRLEVDQDGFVDPEEIADAIRADTFLVSVMHANNEVGTIQPIEEIGEVCREQGVLFHSDAAQSFGKIPLDVEGVGADLLTVSSHKMYGPKGVAALFKREGVEIAPLLHGGGHERGLRSSTPNVAGAVGFARAAEICFREMEQERKREVRLRDKLIDGVLEKVSGSHLNGPREKRLPNNANFHFQGVEGESIVMELDSRGIAASTGSACSSSELKPSHVLLALGLSPEEAHGSLRLTLGRWTKEKEIERVLEVLPSVIEKLGRISPFA